MSSPLNTSPHPDRVKEEQNQLTISYLTLRNLIGWCGFFLPIFLVLFTYHEQGGLKVISSISGYYYTSRGDVFVVLLSVIGVFLITYKGYNWKDWLLSSIAGVCAILVAFNPTTYTESSTPDKVKYCCDTMHISATSSSKTAPNYTDTLYCHDTTLHHFNKMLGYSVHRPHNTVPRIMGKIEWHLLFAATFLVILGLISLIFFPMTLNDDKNNIRRNNKLTQKGKRNRMYKICGWVMLGSIGILLVYFISTPIHNWVGHFPLVFTMETTAVWAFAISWLTKGETLWPDGEHYFITA